MRPIPPPRSYRRGDAAQACIVVSILGGAAIKLPRLLESRMRPAPTVPYSCTVARRTTCSEGNVTFESVSAVTKTLKVRKVVAVFRSPL